MGWGLRVRARARSVRTNSPYTDRNIAQWYVAIAENLRLDTVGAIRLVYLTSSQLVDLDY